MDANDERDYSEERYNRKMTETTAGQELAAQLVEVAKTLGEYPHKAITPGGASGIKTQTTRMLKVACGACDYTVRTTAKWIEVGLPVCPCGDEMSVA